MKENQQHWLRHLSHFKIDRSVDGWMYGWITHTRAFNGPLSGTTQLRQYQKGKTNLDFTEARDSEWQ